MRSGLTVSELEHWELNGAIWRPLEVSGARAVVELCSCSGERMDVVEGDAPDLIEFVRARPDGASA
ncbi:MAG TPA: hypothetical protein VLW51_04895 [Solirubrobacteraceae bacterium]|nr:hypothetical protein [Solirubrobacteraceae bacterium]